MIIDTNDELEAFCLSLLDEEFIAIDTEFMRTTTYWPKLCLIQIASSHQAVAIDVLKPGLNLEPLKHVLKHELITKVFHSVRQDLEALNHTFGRLPCNIMDTQIMAAFCGYGDCIGYDILVRQFCGHHIDKSAQFTNWKKRPLSDQQITYAINDVIHLRHAYKVLCTILDEYDRYEWAMEETDKILDPKLYEPDLDKIWWKIKFKSTQPIYLARLRELSRYRETMAIKHNRTRNHFISDDTLSMIALENPNTAETLYKIKGFPKSLMNHHQSRKILKALEIANQLPESERPSVPPRPRKTQEETHKLDQIKLLLSAAADKCKISKTLIATRKDLENFIRDPDNSPFMQGWRFEVFGKLIKNLGD